MTTDAPGRVDRRTESETRLASRTGDPIDAWLTLLTTLLRLPPGQAGEIRDELEDHLRTRVRDQLVEGVAEHDAVRRAIDEVGEASAVAERFRSAARPPLRKTIMYVSILTVSVAALGFSVAAFTSTPDQPVIFEEAPLAQVEGLGSAEITTDPDWTFEQFVGAMGAAARMPTFIHWRSLSDHGIERDDDTWQFEIDIEAASFETVMRLLNERVDWSGVAARTYEGRLEFIGQGYLDQQTVRLVRFDIADIIEHISLNWTDDRESARDEVIGLIQSYVEPDAWMDNGGEFASTRAVGDQLFIEAPERFFTKIEWLLGQLRAGEHAFGPVLPEVRTYAMEKTAPADVKRLLIDMLATSYEDEWDELAPNITIVPDQDGNLLIVKAPARVHQRLAPLVRLLDTTGGSASDLGSDSAYQVQVGGRFRVREGNSLSIRQIDVNSAMERLKGLVGVSVETVEEHGTEGTSYLVTVSAPCKAVADARIAALWVQADVTIEALRPIRVFEDDANPPTVIRLATRYPEAFMAELDALALHDDQLAGAEWHKAGEFSMEIRGPASAVERATRKVPSLNIGLALISEGATAPDEHADVIFVEGEVHEPGTYRLPVDGYVVLADLPPVPSMNTMQHRGSRRWARVIVRRHVEGELRVVANHANFIAKRNTFKVLPGDRVEFVSPDDTYLVQPGDTGRSIAARIMGDAGSWSAIARFNGLDPDAATLRVGQQLALPGRSPGTPR